MAIVKRITAESHAYGRQGKHILYQDRLIRNEPIEKRAWVNGKAWSSKDPLYIGTYRERTKEEMRAEVKQHTEEFRLTITLESMGHEFKRSRQLHLGKHDWKVVAEKDSTGGREYTILIEREHWEEPLIKLIKKEEGRFYLTEEELLLGIHDWLQSEETVKWFKRQVNIGSRVADAVAMVNDRDDPELLPSYKLIGFEAKTDADNYERLYGQVDEYLKVCDMVYMVVQGKEPPKDLPFYVGIIKVEEDMVTIVRRATELKKTLYVNDLWLTIQRLGLRHAGVKGKKDPDDFWQTVENMKRKLLYNQYVIGFRTKWVEDYVSFTDKEKAVLQSFYTP